MSKNLGTKLKMCHIPRVSMIPVLLMSSASFERETKPSI